MKQTCAAVFLFLIFISIDIFSQNPVCPPGIYIADPSARVWDNKLYLYGSTDESCEYYCSWHHDVMFTEDLKTWEIADQVFASKGENDQVPYNNSLLFAPDCIRSGDKYFLYYCQPDRESAEGVAIGSSPTGPFTEGKKLNTGPYNQIDPAVFIDDDGTAYYLWGQFTLKMAKLNPGMTSIDTTTIRDSILTESGHFFHEGAYLTKRNGIYYLVYADISREDKPTCIGYATSRQPFGPYEYGGVIVDNDGCNPGNWNNHGSIAGFNGQWYVFYHRSTHGCKTMRKACVEKIGFLPDGSIPEVEMTSQGAGPPLTATQTIDAATACLLHGNVRIEAVTDTNEILSGFHSGDAAIYKYLDFGNGVKTVSLRINVHEPCKLLITADKPWHKRLVLADVKPGEPAGEWQILTFDVNPVEGIHALWIQAYGDSGKKLLDIDWLKFD